MAANLYRHRRRCALIGWLESPPLGRGARLTVTHVQRAQRCLGVEVVLSVALGRADDSARWEQVAHPSPSIWMHHLELARLDDLDEEVRDWLVEAYEAAGQG